MIFNSFTRTLIPLSLISIIGTGCITKNIDKKDFIDSNISKIKKYNKNILDSKPKIKEKLKYIKYNIYLDEYDNLDNIKTDTNATLQIVDKPLKDVLNDIADSFNINIFNNFKLDETLNKKISFTCKNMDIKNLLLSLEKIADLDIVYNKKSNIIYTYDTIEIQGNFNSLQSANMPSFKSLTTSLNNLFKTNDYKEISIDDNTGAFIISSTPKKIRSLKKFIENTMNQVSSYSLLKLYIYKISDSKLKEFGLNLNTLYNDISSINLGVNSLGATSSFSMLGVKKTSINNHLTSFTFGLNMLEEKNIIHSIANSSLTVFNGLKSTLNDTQQVGYWIPGDTVEEDKLVNDIMVTTSREEKPTFEEDNVGNTIDILPRIDINNKLIQMDISYKESKIYSENNTIWNKTADSSVTLKKPLKSETSFNTRVILENNKYSIITGTKQKSVEMLNNGVPGANVFGNNRNSSTYSDVMIIAKATMPDYLITENIYKSNTINIPITKKDIIANKNIDEVIKEDNNITKKKNIRSINMLKSYSKKRGKI